MAQYQELVIAPDIRFTGYSIILDRLPEPISVNEFCNRRYPTKKKKLFDAQFENWTVRNNMRTASDEVLGRLLGNHREEELKALERGSSDLYFDFCYRWKAKMLTKPDRTRKTRHIVRRDSSNFVKAIEDSLADWLGIDDKYYKDFCFKTEHTDEPKKYNFSVEMFRPRKYKEEEAL